MDQAKKELVEKVEEALRAGLNAFGIDAAKGTADFLLARGLMDWCPQGGEDHRSIYQILTEE